VDHTRTRRRKNSYSITRGWREGEIEKGKRKLKPLVCVYFSFKNCYVALATCNEKEDGRW